jgi:hypothetical protein
MPVVIPFCKLKENAIVIILFSKTEDYFEFFYQKNNILNVNIYLRCINVYIKCINHI